MGQLEKTFRPYRLAGSGAASAAAGGCAGAAAVAAGGAGVAGACQLEQLQVMYLYLQAAVVGGEPSEVLAAVHNLIGSSSSTG